MKKNTPILVIDPFPEAFVAELHSLSDQVEYSPKLSREEILARLPEAEVVIMNSRIRMDAEALAHAGKLKLLCRAGVGMDHFDLPLLDKMEVRVMNAPGMNAQPVGEQTVGMLLSMMHRISHANAEVQQFQWNRELNRGTELRGKTVGVIGFGNTGTATAGCLSGFGCRILAYDKYKSGYGNETVVESDLETIFREADIVTLHIPLTEETEHYADAGFFANFEKKVWFLNLSRGPVTQLGDLTHALQSGWVAGAALDVLPNENMATLTADEKAQIEALYATGRVIITPHIGGWSHESLRRINNRMLDAVRLYMGGSGFRVVR